MSNSQSPEIAGLDCTSWTRRAADIEALASSGSSEAVIQMRALRDDIEHFVEESSDTSAELITRARDVVVLLDRLADGLASDHVQSITGLERQLRRLEPSLKTFLLRPAGLIPNE